MPEMIFDVRWPDGSVDRCYSPSLVMHDHLTDGASYTVDDFVSRSVSALDTASERVRAKYGFACTSAMATSEQIISRSARFAGDAVVTVAHMHPPLDTPDTAGRRSQGAS
ncbi:MAG: MSMEG_0570 family nitrogen starvation response protein [Corynebacteriales bacterium]|nr:MSMEG_0570 family nitrogen starvation response protein [Mycobacteriales bacterium]